MAGLFFGAEYVAKELSIKNKAGREKLAEQQARLDIRAVMEKPEGRRVIWRFLEMSRVNHSPFNTNAMALSHAVAWQDAGRYWIASIDDSCPELYAVMRSEARKAEKAIRQLEELEEQDND